MTRVTLALLALLTLFVTPGALAAAPADDPAHRSELKVDQRQWKLVSERDGIKVYMAHSDESRVKTFRGVMDVEIDDIYSLPALTDDYEFYPRWLYLISELSEVRKRTAQDRDLLLRTRLPWPVADRDAGLGLVFHQDPKTLAFGYALKARADIIPVNEKYVRIPEMIGHFNVTPVGGKKVRIDFEVLLDPGGYIPAFLVNFILKDIPYQSLQRFRRVINTERFQGYYVDYLKVPEPWASMPEVPRSTVLPVKRGKME